MENKRLSCIKNRLKQDIKPKKIDHVNMEHASFLSKWSCYGSLFQNGGYIYPYVPYLHRRIMYTLTFIDSK